MRNVKSDSSLLIRSLLLAAAVMVVLSGCASILGLVTYYDPTTYKNLTDLKPEVAALHDTLHQAPLDSANVASVRLKLAQMYEYEKGKGPRNTETARQLQFIRDMFEDHLSHGLLAGTASPTALKGYLGKMQKAFDKAIETERLKNKNK